MNPDELAELEEERGFLLRSITDLDREREAGDLDEADYQSLRDGYTARAAKVLRAIEDGRAALPQARKRSAGSTAAWVVGTLVVAGLLGWLLAIRSGPRSDGQTMTGGQPADEITVKLSEARANLGSNPGKAADAYIAVLKLDPRNVEALTYSGWLLVQQGRAMADQPGAADLIVLGSKNLRDATSVDPSYADPHCFLAITAARFIKPADTETAKTEAQQCLALNPPAQMVGMIESFLASLDTTTTTER
mgnify:CR=1 FL=1